MSTPDIRVHRAYRWVSDPITESTRFGEPIGMHLETVDTLEYWDPQAGRGRGEWIPVPVVEEEKPPHPCVSSAEAAFVAPSLGELMLSMREALRKS